MFVIFKYKMCYKQLVLVLWGVQLLLAIVILVVKRVVNRVDVVALQYVRDAGKPGVDDPKGDEENDGESTRKYACVS